jgi:ABC-2 type transport system ATP-binding protein
MNVIEASGLGKRHGRSWALRECTLAIPAGHVTALVGPNGAGKTTLLHMVVGLSRPDAGRLAVLGGERPGSPAALVGTGFVPQHMSLYRDLTVADTVHLARNLNQRWDQPWTRARLDELAIPLKRRVGRLSGGQRVQLALTLAIAKRPRLLVLDEPLAQLDPLARHDCMASVMAAVAEDGLSVVFSSHVLAELERVADYLIVINAGRLQLAGAIEDLLGSHRILTGPAAEQEPVPRRTPVVHARHTGAQAQLLVRTADPAASGPAGWESSPATLEELVLGYLREPGASALPGPAPLPPAASPVMPA